MVSAVALTDGELAYVDQIRPATDFLLTYNKEKRGACSCHGRPASDTEGRIRLCLWDTRPAPAHASLHLSSAPHTSSATRRRQSTASLPHAPTARARVTTSAPLGAAAHHAGRTRHPQVCAASCSRSRRHRSCEREDDAAVSTRLAFTPGAAPLLLPIPRSSSSRQSIRASPVRGFARALGSEANARGTVRNS